MICDVQKVIDIAIKRLKRENVPEVYITSVYEVNTPYEISPCIYPLSVATFNSTESYNRRSTLLQDRSYPWRKKRGKRERERIEGKLVRRYEYGTRYILRPLFTLTWDTLLYFRSPFHSSSDTMTSMLIFSFSLFLVRFFLPAIHFSPTLDRMHIRSTSPNRINLLSYCASLRLNNIYAYQRGLLYYYYLSFSFIFKLRKIRIIYDTLMPITEIIDTFRKYEIQSYLLYEIKLIINFYEIHASC